MFCLEGMRATPPPPITRTLKIILVSLMNSFRFRLLKFYELDRTLTIGRDIKIYVKFANEHPV